MTKTATEAVLDDKATADRRLDAAGRCSELLGEKIQGTASLPAAAVDL